MKCPNLRVGSVSLDVDYGEVAALLDVDVEAAGHGVVYEAELEVALDGDGAVAALALAVHARHGLGPRAEAGQGASLHQAAGVASLVRDAGIRTFTIYNQL